MFKHTGIVRRIDDIGRISIPKDIRRRFRIKEGDPIEIGENDDSIALRKYNAIDLHDEKIKKVLAAFSKLTRLPVILCNETHTICSTMNRFSRQKMPEQFNNLYMSDELTNAITDLKNNAVGLDVLGTSEYIVEWCEKIMFNDSARGALIIPSDEHEVTDSDKKCLKICADIIASMYE